MSDSDTSTSKFTSRAPRKAYGYKLTEAPASPTQTSASNALTLDINADHWENDSPVVKKSGIFNLDDDEGEKSPVKKSSGRGRLRRQSVLDQVTSDSVKSTAEPTSLTTLPKPTSTTMNSPKISLKKTPLISKGDLPRTLLLKTTRDVFADLSSEDVATLTIKTFCQKVWAKTGDFSGDKEAKKIVKEELTKLLTPPEPEPEPEAEVQEEPEVESDSDEDADDEREEQERLRKEGKKKAKKDKKEKEKRERRERKREEIMKLSKMESVKMPEMEETEDMEKDKKKEEAYVCSDVGSVASYSSASDSSDSDLDKKDSKRAAFKKSLANIEMKVTGVKAKVISEELVTGSELNNEEQEKMEKIADLFDVDDADIKNKHEELLSKMSARLAPVKAQIKDEVGEEYKVLKEQAKKQQELEKKMDVIASVKEAEGEAPVLGRCFVDDGSDSDSDFEFDLEVKKEVKQVKDRDLFSPSKLKNKKGDRGRRGLKNILRGKVQEKGNAWLAKELEYASVEEHVRDCRAMEVGRRMRGEREEKKAEKKQIQIEEKMEEEEMDSDDEEYVAPNEEEESDDEMEEEGGENIGAVKEKIVFDDAEPIEQEANDESREQAVVNDSMEEIQEDVDMAMTLDENNVTVSASANVDDSESPKATVPVKTAVDVNDESPNSEKEEVEAAQEGGDEENEHEEEEEESEPAPKKDRAAAFRAMLEADAKAAKSKKKNMLMEDEAEEEEEEEAVAGLEDFGFGTTKKKDGDEDEAKLSETITADDLEHIVDTHSDDEGDEEEGAKNRAEAAAKEEKKRHKEMMRRMKEGYDGRRGGGSGARGKVDWNSLVAAGGKKQAKKLGLLNSDEENSSDEESEEEDEEDEMALLDKMLKERHGMTKRDHQLAAELASDSEEESESEGEDEGVLEKEEKEQERLAKRIAKRAKMQRLLAEYGDSQSQSMLLDEVRTCEERSDEL
ncbi:hypothetical protein TrLO_g11115 [Triparma laevis f. longispina]|uniref:Uncharacterized protein n=1 Tax=Triparma laevis f. longispina TaxID=1714387 RepID=A0A9W7F524_9STRA|nr:hypothetical protein TrLO_g11115 [Triparma laevis f. longispina]